MTDQRTPPTALDVVPGVDGLRPEHGPLFAVVGVFDGLHRGHAYLLEKLVAAAREADARPAVITFDSHPDQVLVGSAPPLLLDPAERLERLAAAGVTVAVVQHFDDELRRTEYDAFIGRITSRTRLAGLLMTPDAAFGYERRGTPEALMELGRRSEPPFGVVVVPPFTVDGRAISSSEIRRRVLDGDLAGAERLIGRPYAVAGSASDNGRLRFSLPVALPPPGDYSVTVQRGSIGDDIVTTARIDAGELAVAVDPAPGERVSVVFDAH
jgi:riboflavin kinase/FMN adenylyltransferase